jgi:hypothetical protein
VIFFIFYYFFKQLNSVVLSEVVLIISVRTAVKNLILSLVLLGGMNTAIAGAMEDTQLLPWHFNASLGYVNYDDMVDSNVAIQRISGARDVFDYHGVAFGVELGVQTGLSSRLWANQAELDILGTSATEMVINPFVDVLGTATLPLDLLTNLPAKHLNIFTKIGIAYRQMHFDNQIIHRKVQISPEVQVGLSRSLSHQATVALAYQGIYASKTRLTVVNSASGSVDSIPSQNGALLIFAWNAA